MKTQAKLSNNESLPRTLWLTGLGSIAVAGNGVKRVASDLIKQVQPLLDRGGKLEESAAAAGHSVKSEIFERVDELIKTVESSVDTGLRTFGFSTRTEIDELNKKIEQLAKAVESLQSSKK